MQDQTIKINFNFQVIIFFMFLEGLTVPLVAISNSFTATNILYSAIMGFVVAAICILFLFTILKKLIIRHAEKIFNIKLIDFKGIILIGAMAGILLMLMFIVQFVLFSHGANDYVAGFFSGSLSVLGTLTLYEIFSRMAKLFNIILVESTGNIYKVHFKFRDIIIFSILFGVYELIVCPITGIWIPFTTWRIPMAILSGIIGGGCGGFFLFLSTNFFKLKVYLKLNIIQH